MEFLIPLLFFAIPLAAALLDKRAKERRGAGTPSRSRPAPVPPQRGASARQVSPHARLSVRQSERQTVPGTAPEQPLEEGIRAIQRKDRPTENTAEQGRRSVEIDKKKLILYSEILKPKFDE